jgi:hypothetical protein
MTDIYLLVLLFCDATGCYQDRLYSQTEYATRDECERQPIFLKRLHPDMEFKVVCMTSDEWAKTPKYQDHR